MADISVDLSDIDKLADQLKKFSKTAVPIANQFAINSGAFEARQQWQGNIKSDLISRNKFTVNSIRVEKAVRGLVITRQMAVVGSIAPYMDDQEFGGVIASKSGADSRALPTTSASGEGRDTKPRLKLPRGKRRIQNIRLTKRPRVKGRRAGNAAAINDAARKTGFVLLDQGLTKRRQGVFKVQGRKGKYKLTMLYDLSQRTVKIKPTKTLTPAIKTVRNKMPEIYLKALRFQVNRLNLFK